MRTLLIVALLLYNVVALEARQGNYDYGENDGIKRHSFIDDRRNWRTKALTKRIYDHKDWDNRIKYDFDNQRYIDDSEPKGIGGDGGGGERQREMELSSNYRRRFDDDKINLQSLIKSSETGHSAGLFMGKDQDKKLTITMNCDRQHERYEACFAGCSSVTCDNPRDRLRPCYPFCEPGCICVHPYVRDDRTHKCVLPDDCTKGLKGIPDIGEEYK